jgi:hypothetical protein
VGGGDSKPDYMTKMVSSTRGCQRQGAQKGSKFWVSSRENIYSHPHERSGSQKDQFISGSLKLWPCLCGEFSNFFTPGHHTGSQKPISGASYLVGGGVGSSSFPPSFFEEKIRNQIQKG